MFKGAVEGVTEEVAFGWMYSSAERLRDQLVLAFHHDRCIGAGKIEHFREDLAHAGLGDGYLGYHFSIDSPGKEALAEVVIRLEGSDAVFMQRGSRLVGSGPAVDLRLSERELGAALSSLKWRLSHGVLDQPDYDYLRSIWQFGVYERVLRRSSGEEDTADISASRLAAKLMSVYQMDDVEVQSIKVASSDAFQTEMERLRKADTLIPIVGIWTSEKANLKVLEGSHVRYSISRAFDASSGVGYGIKSDQLVLLDMRAEAALEIIRGETEIFVGSR